MRVSSIISYNLSGQQVNNNLQLEKHRNRESFNFFWGRSPDNGIFKDVSGYPISFLARLPYKNLDRVPCALCNRPMIPIKKFNEIRWPVKAENNEAYNSALIKTLEPFKSYMHENELFIFWRIKLLHRKYPQKTFQQLLEMLRPKYLQLLEAEQTAILNDIDGMIDNFSSMQQKKTINHDLVIQLKTLISETKSIVISSEVEKHFLRKVFFAKLGLLIKQNPNAILLKKVKEKAADLPTSRDSISAFIVKYSGKVPSSKKSRAPLGYRSSKDIMENLLRPACETFDHVHPKVNGGVDNLDNALGVCAYCNNDLKNKKNFRVFINRPNIIRNIELHMQYLIKHVKQIKKGIKYIKDLAKTLERLSNGLIKTDLSAFEKKKPIPETI